MGAGTVDNVPMERGNVCMCVYVCVPEHILRQAFLTFPCGSLCQFNLFFMPHAASYCDCDADADADGDRGFCTWRRHQKTLLCGRVCFEMGVREAECAENNVQKSFAFAILRHGCSICSLTLCHTHTRRIIYVFVHITAMRHVLTHTHTFVSLRFFALSAYLRRSHLAASLPLALSLQHLLSYIELT